MPVSSEVRLHTAPSLPAKLSLLPKRLSKVSANTLAFNTYTGGSKEVRRICACLRCPWARAIW